MSTPFPIFAVPSDAAEAQEAMGTKPKFWFDHPTFGRCLFKQARSQTGEDWSEKIAAEIARLIGLPHAKQELATYRNHPGTLSPLMIPEQATLIHSNDVLAGIVSGYPRDERYNVSEHTLSIVLEAINKPIVHRPIDWTPPKGITTALDTFIGYLLLDAWIGNTDRHHENWGLVETIDQTTHLSPTYDHASCLGRELLDTAREQRVQNKSVLAYTKKARSAFFLQAGDKKSLLTIEVFTRAAQYAPRAAALWLQRLESIAPDTIKELLCRIPTVRISPLAIAFALEVLDINRSKLLRLQETLP